MITRIFYGICLFALAACSASPPIIPQSNPPGPRPVPVTIRDVPVAAQMAGDWTDWPLAKGSWVYRTDARGSVALFGQEQRDAVVTIRCDRAQGRIYITRADEAGTGRAGAGASSGTITVRASSALKTFGASATGGNPAYIAAEIMPADPILDAIIYTRGRFALQGSGGQSVAIPVYAEIAKVVEDCRA
jgi:hypothetical protein